MATYGAIPTASPGSTRGEYISRAKERMRSGLSIRRPWKQMVHLHAFNLPSSFRDVFSRIKTNLAYFRMNYTIIVLLIIFLSLLWHPISLIVLVIMMVAWLFLYFLRDEPLKILGRTINDKVVLVLLSIITIVLLLLTRATINVLVSLLVGAVLVLIHSVFRKTEDLFVDEETMGSAQYEPLSSS